VKRPRPSEPDLLQVLRSAALGYPETEEGIACEGTPLEKRTVKVRNKAFLFLGAKDAMLKLSDSLAEANELAERAPGRCKVGAHGWVTVAFGEPESPPLELLLRWIDESYRLLAPKTLLAGLPSAKQEATSARKTPKRQSRKKKPKTDG
jgi:hypothetical protein